MRLLITYPWFYPAYKAGGPVQSIKNTAFSVAGDGDEVYILCSNKELDGATIPVTPDIWTDFENGVKVYYNSQPPTLKSISAIIKQVSPDVIFINGLYSLPYTIYPLMYNGRMRKIVSVRGMLHPGALSQKTAKKKLFLTFFKFRGLHNKCEYHATANEEAGYIYKMFGRDKKVWVVPNLPNVLPYLLPVAKQVGMVKLVSVSLISPMKNILLVLQSLQQVKANITYHIYGPVKDARYWEECKTVINQLPRNINVEYKGEVLPHMIQGALKDYHYFVLPSKSENFGHAIYEALSAGRPVITSHKTPWNGLDNAGAGYNITPEDTGAFALLLEKLAMIPGEEYREATLKAKTYIENQYNIDNIKKQYGQMFAS